MIDHVSMVKLCEIWCGSVVPSFGAVLCGEVLWCVTAVQCDAKQSNQALCNVRKCIPRSVVE